MEDIEKVLDDIEKFKSNENDESISSFLKHVAITGDPVFPWIKVKDAIRHKLSLVMSAFYQGCGVGESAVAHQLMYTTSTNNILEQFDTFTGAPFTIQRICEMLLDPRKHYQDPHKFIRGMEKNMLVVSCVTPGCMSRSNTSQESIVNGMVEDVSLYLGVNSQENTCDSVMTNVEHTSETSSNGLLEDICSSSSSGSSSASSSPSPDDDPDLMRPSVKRPKLSLYEDSGDLGQGVFEASSCFTPANKEAVVENVGEVDTSEQYKVQMETDSKECIDSYIQERKSAGSPDSAQECHKNQVEMVKDTDENSEAMATLEENTEEASNKSDVGSENIDSSEADSTSQPCNNEASSTEMSNIQFSVEDTAMDDIVSTENDTIQEAAQPDVLDSASDICNANFPEDPNNESPCTSSLP